MSWKEFDNNHKYQKKIILIVSGVVIAALLIVLIAMSTSQAYFALKVAPQIKSELLVEDVCFLAFDSIARKRSNPLVIDEGYLASMEKVNFSFIDFYIKDDSYRILRKEAQGKCKIVINASNKKGHNLRSFVAEYSHDTSYPFNYKVNNVYEVMLDKKDLTGGQ